MAAVIVRRIFRIAIAMATAAAIIAMTASCSGSSSREDAAYCAILPDTVGLYVGNPVTQMGYQIGKVTSIDANPTQVRVDFSVAEGRPLPHDVKAVIRSPSILADRALELVGNYSGGARLDGGSCISLDHSFSPKTISEVVGSAYNFINSINPDGSTNIDDTVRGVDQLVHNNGAGVNQLLTRTSSMLDSPDQAISEIGSIVRNTAELTATLVELRDPLKEILQDSPVAIQNAGQAVNGTAGLAGPGGGVGTLGPLAELVAILESRLGEPTQILLDHTSATIRKVTPHINALSDLFVVAPWWINTVANHFNRRDFHTFNLAYRPPLYRIPTHNGLALCGMMNAASPGSCADVNGQPFAVDVALLQYVLTQAANQ
ncbi:MlaD family protein [Mycobacterium sp. pUA109]|uniref:MlaD family protein n=1 Tax=Mycobacterium sp. pUA109 TaxID=3238982 RepID=UPI00351B44DB